MKSTIFIIIILLSQFSLFAQKDSTEKLSIQHGGGAGVYLSGGSHGPCLFTDYTIERGKSLISVGPLFNQDLFVGADHGVRRQTEGFNLTGGHCSYVLYPNDTKNTFNLFFQLDMAFFKNKIDAYNEYFHPYHLVLTQLNEKVLETTISYGFRINFLKRFYFNQSLGIGAIFINQKYLYEDETTRNSKGKSLTGLFKIGLGFRI